MKQPANSCQPFFIQERLLQRMMDASTLYARMKSLCLALLTFTFVLAAEAQTPALRLTPDQVSRIGKRIWQNECGGTVEGLTSWNTGEDFASLGIGHFIWYPAGKEGPFEESFPALVRYLQGRRFPLPAWLPKTPDCPWLTRDAFRRDSAGGKQQDLRRMLSASVREQTEFIMLRLQNALPKMLSAAPRNRRAGVESNFNYLLATPEGAFAMIDYVNFKGEGTNPSERYNGQGWGLLQVLLQMPTAGKSTPAFAFSEASKQVLSLRVRNAPAARGESRWLPGWHNRCESYKRKL